ncbi:hypothetical protein B4110_0220 [Parageobacillus toebii]|uniref:Uncharacterized protein n=1 Tax=Parageobacillus toebii TaxID=153151 RepID=A0A150MBH4_9BACL|nr:hypothetical protein B4110_0220 [Parageobacillus toebii]
MAKKCFSDIESGFRLIARLQSGVRPCLDECLQLAKELREDFRWKELGRGRPPSSM